MSNSNGTVVAAVANPDPFTNGEGEAILADTVMPEEAPVFITGNEGASLDQLENYQIPMPRSFKPKDVMVNLAKRGDTPRLYLPVAWRLVWFREVYPHGQIETVEQQIDIGFEHNIIVSQWSDEKRRSEKVNKDGKGYARFKAMVTTPEGGHAEGTKSCLQAEFGDYVEKAETGAIGRALAALGFGTQFTDREFEEGQKLADSPVAAATRGSKPVARPMTGSKPVASPTPVSATKSTATLQGPSAEEEIKQKTLEIVKQLQGDHELADFRKFSNLGAPGEWQSGDLAAAARFLKAWKEDSCTQNQRNDIIALTTAGGGKLDSKLVKPFMKAKYACEETKLLKKGQATSLAVDLQAILALSELMIAGEGDPNAEHLMSMIPQDATLAGLYWLYRDGSTETLKERSAYQLYVASKAAAAKLSEQGKRLQSAILKKAAA